MLRELLTGSAARTTDVATTPVVPEAGAAPAGATLDTERLDELAEMGVAAVPLIQRAIDNFVGGAVESLDTLRRAFAHADTQLLRSAAHRLKGSAANLGAVRVAQLAFELEQLADGGELDGADVLLAELAGDLEAAAASLADYRLVASEEPRSA